MDEEGSVLLAPRYPVNWWDSVLSVPRYPEGSPFSFQVEPVNWRDSALVAPRYPVVWGDSVLSALRCPVVLEPSIVERK